MADTTNKIQVELHVPDFEVVLDFYGKLGFKKVWHRSENNNADYLVMEREATLLNFWPGNENVYDQSYFKRFPKDTKRGYGVELVIPVDDVKAFHEEVKGFANIVNPLVKRPWGLWDFRIEDPFGYYLRITERHDITDPNYAVPEGEKDND
jgi:lactoylglutathione lyase